MYHTDNRRRIRLAIVSPCPPQASPVAVRTDELCRMLRVVAPRIALSVWAIDGGDGSASTAGDMPVAGRMTSDDPSAYPRAAQRLRRLGVNVALLVFGHGTAGGPHGRYILGLTDELARQGVPYLVALDDVRHSPLPDDADVITALCRPAAGVIVASGSARTALIRNRLVAPRRVAVVPQGAPPELLHPRGHDTPAVGLPPALADLPAGPLLSTIGHLRPAKGIEVAIAALPTIATRHPDLSYVVAGRTHAVQARLAGERYRGALLRAAEASGVANLVHLLDADLARPDLAALLHATDVYVGSDLDRGRTSSDSLGYALAAGCRVVTTDHPYARETVPDGAGVVVAPGDPTALAAAVNRLLDNPTRRAGSAPAVSVSSIFAAEQIAGLVALVASPLPAVAGRQHAA
jgi:glycosyltransferase involved in cell wall biosynthesis